MKNQKQSQESSHLSRRSLLKTLLFTPPILMFTEGCFSQGQKVEPVFKPRIVPQGEKIRIAQIGVYNRGNDVLNSFRPFVGKQAEFVAFTDVAFLDRDFRMKAYPNAPCFRDYREMLEQMYDQIDAVVICTPDHAHFAPVMHSMLLGKHVYVEKPMAQNVYESRLMEKTARDCGVVTQMGNQGHSGGGTIQFGLWVDAGLVKNVTRIDSWMVNSRRWHGWTDKAYPESTPPVGYDWDQWLGRRPFRPYSDKLVNGNWRSWYEFGCGAMGDWGAHILDAVHRYLKLGLPYEITTTLKGPSDLLFPQGSVITFKFPARENMPPVELKWYDGQGNLPPAPDGYQREMGMVGSLIYTEDYIIRGTSHGAGYKILPNEKMTELAGAGKLPAAPRNLPDHSRNFLNACQGIEPANSRFEISAPLAEVLCLGCIGQRFGGTLKYDAKTMTITNHPEANKMLRGPAVREGWGAYDQQKPVLSKKAQIQKPEAVKWENLFVDAKLSNWENPYKYGKAEYAGGEVSLSSDNGKWFLLTKKEYANFILEGEVKLPVKEGNSGFVFRCQKMENRVWGYQAEVDPSDRKWSGGLYDEGRRMWFVSPNSDQAASETAKNESIAAFRARAGECYKQGEWNLYRIECIGGHIRIWVNEVLTTDVFDEMDLSGPVGIQHHGEKGLVYKFRNLRIKDLGAGGEIYYPHREKAKAAPVPSKMDGAIYEAESAKLTGCSKADNQPGFQGTGFVNMGTKNSTLEWDNVLGEQDGNVTLTFRYASPSSRPCDLVVNNASVGRIPFDSTGNLTTWKTVDMKTALKKGTNSIKIIAIDAGPNLDAMAIK